MSKKDLAEVKKIAKNEAFLVAVNIFGRDNSEVHKQPASYRILENLQWILDPQEVFIKLIDDTKVLELEKELDGIEDRYKQRSEWIIQFQQKKQK